MHTSYCYFSWTIIVISFFSTRGTLVCWDVGFQLFYYFMFTVHKFCKKIVFLIMIISVRFYLQNEQRIICEHYLLVFVFVLPFQRSAPLSDRFCKFSPLLQIPHCQDLYIADGSIQTDDGFQHYTLAWHRSEGMATCFRTLDNRYLLLQSKLNHCW